MINNKVAAKSGKSAQNDTSMFGKPQRLPQQLDESMLYEPKAIQFNPSQRGSKNILNEVLTNPIQPQYIVEQQGTPALSGNKNQISEGRDSYVRPLKLQKGGFQEEPSPRMSSTSYRPSYVPEEEEFRRMIMEKEMADRRGDYESYRKESNSIGQRPTGGSVKYQQGGVSSDELMSENVRLKIQNKALLAENGRLLF